MLLSVNLRYSEFGTYMKVYCGQYSLGLENLCCPHESAKPVHCGADSSEPRVAKREHLATQGCAGIDKR